jgi:dipeptidase E
MTNIILASNLSGYQSDMIEFCKEHAKGTHMLFVPTAAYGEGWSPDYETDILPFEQDGLTVELFDLVDKSTEQVKDALERAHIVYISGGNTFYLLKHMRESGFYSHVIERVHAGLVYMGSSAGSVVATGDIAYASPVDDPAMGGPNLDTTGLGLFADPILPHMDHPDFAPHVHKIMANMQRNGQSFCGLNDSQALVIENGVASIRSATRPNTDRHPAP